MLREDQIRRYARHVLLPDVGGIGQARLLAATVAVDVSTPAGIVAATYLAAAGVGALVLTGGDRPATAADVAAGIALGAADLGRPVRDAVVARLSALNPDVRFPPTPDAPRSVSEVVHARPVSEVGHAVHEALVEGGRRACAVAHAIARGAA